MLSSKHVYKMKFTFLLHTCFTIKSCLGSVTLSTHTGHTLNAYVTNQPTPLSCVFSQKTTANIAGCLVFITIIPITGITSCISVSESSVSNKLYLDTLAFLFAFLASASSCSHLSIAGVVRTSPVFAWTNFLCFFVFAKTDLVSSNRGEAITSMIAF